MLFTVRIVALAASCSAPPDPQLSHINTWLRQYNHIRPHHALNMRPPVPETILEKPQIIRPD